MSVRSHNSLQSDLQHTHTHIYIYINKIQVYKYITTQSIAAIRIIKLTSPNNPSSPKSIWNLHGTWILRWLLFLAVGHVQRVAAKMAHHNTIMDAFKISFVTLGKRCFWFCTQLFHNLKKNVWMTHLSPPWTAVPPLAPLSFPAFGMLHVGLTKMAHAGVIAPVTKKKSKAYQVLWMPFGFFLSLYRWHFPHSVLFGFVLNQKIHPDYECLYAATILCKATSNTHTHIYINKIQVYKYITTQSIAAIRIIKLTSPNNPSSPKSIWNLHGTWILRWLLFLAVGHVQRVAAKMAHHNTIMDAFKISFVTLGKRCFWFCTQLFHNLKKMFGWRISLLLGRRCLPWLLCLFLHLGWCMWDWLRWHMQVS